jgi:hypothetical protein
LLLLKDQRRYLWALIFEQRFLFRSNTFRWPWLRLKRTSAAKAVLLSGVGGTAKPVPFVQGGLLLRLCLGLSLTAGPSATLRFGRDDKFLQNLSKERFVQGRTVSVRTEENLVELTGIEPVTPCLQSRCSPS